MRETTEILPGRRPAASRKSPILKPDGTPATFYLYPTPRNNPRHYKPRPTLSPDTKTNVSAYDRKELVNLSRQLVSQVEVLGAAVSDKNEWAVGDAWEAHYQGENKAWGDEMERILNQQWMPNANVRGPQWPFVTSLLISARALDVDGDDVMLLTQTANGFPQVAFYPAPKIESGPTRNSISAGTELVSGGQFDGAKIFDGIVMDRNMRAIAVRIMSDDGKSFTDVSTFQADLNYEPLWHDQGRGIPRIATSLLRWFSLTEIDEFLARGVKRASSIGLIEKNEEGEAPSQPNQVPKEVDGDPHLEEQNGEEPTVHYEEVIEGGEMYYLSSGGNESIAGLVYKNPHPNTESFVARLTRGSLRSIGWNLELIDFSATGRAPSRLLTDIANWSIWARQRATYRRWKRAIGYAVAVLMRNGYAPKNDDATDAFMFEPGLPKPLQVDAGNDAQADRESLKLGTVTKAILAQKNHGLHYRTIDRQRATELRETIAEADAISREYPWVTKDRALELLEQRSPNPISQQPKPTPGQQNKGAAP